MRQDIHPQAQEQDENQSLQFEDSVLHQKED